MSLAERSSWSLVTFVTYECMTRRLWLFWSKSTTDFADVALSIFLASTALSGLNDQQTGPHAKHSHVVQRRSNSAAAVSSIFPRLKRAASQTTTEDRYGPGTLADRHPPPSQPRSTASRAPLQHACVHTEIKAVAGAYRGEHRRGGGGGECLRRARSVTAPHLSVLAERRTGVGGQGEGGGGTAVVQREVTVALTRPLAPLLSPAAARCRPGCQLRLPGDNTSGGSGNGSGSTLLTGLRRSSRHGASWLHALPSCDKSLG